MAYGTRKLTLPNGETDTIADRVRILVASRIIQQYSQYCQEVGYERLSNSSLWRIIRRCEASQRKAISGLDNITANGLNAIDSFQEILDNLASYDLSQTWVNSMKTRVGQAGVYLKMQYRQHLSLQSQCADHCIAYALSDGSDSLLTKKCDHIHDVKCDDCESIKSLEADIMEKVVKLEAPLRIIDELRHDTHTAGTSIYRWRSHILRAYRQDTAKHDILLQMSNSAGMLFLDFAMKFLPQTHHETQQDFYAKKGISWHVSVLVRKVNGTFKVSVFYHIIQNGIQDWYAVVSIIQNLLNHLKTIHPELDTMYIRSDNAGCYHSAATVLSMPAVSTSTGILIKRMDFSEPCYGKDICDRRTAPVKMHVSRYIHAGNDVTNGPQLREAIHSFGGIQGTQACVGLMKISPKDKPGPWIGISKFNNFEFTRYYITLLFFPIYLFQKLQQVCIKSMLLIKDFWKAHHTWSFVSCTYCFGSLM